MFDPRLTDAKKIRNKLVNEEDGLELIGEMFNPRLDQEKHKEGKKKQTKAMYKRLSKNKFINAVCNFKQSNRNTLLLFT
jgi:hypothetical protein